MTVPLAHMRPSDDRARARARARASASGIGLAVVQDIGERASGGKRWKCLVTDGERFHYVEVAAPDVPARAGVSPADVEAAIERRAERFPPDSRLYDLVALSPIQLDPADLRPLE